MARACGCSISVPDLEMFRFLQRASLGRPGRSSGSTAGDLRSQPQDCAPAPGFSRDVAIIGQVSNELWCGVEAQQDLAKSAPFRNLAEGEFIKIMCVKNG